jgi:undecaprenyl diphosphate synthase
VAFALPLKEFPDLSLTSERLPRHVAIVMDGNGRWAKKHGLARCEGHRRGKDSVRAVIDTARELGIPYLTLFAFSHENWSRPPEEVNFLMQLFYRYLLTEINRFMKHDIRIIGLGDLQRLPPEVRSALARVEEATKANAALTAVLAISYGGRQDIAGAVRRIAHAVESRAVRPEEVDERMLESQLATTGLPDPDLLIRTSGELRISNFFLYQLAYTELYFTDTLWPDFREREFLTALAAYQLRDRRFGAIRNGTSHSLRAAS